MTASKYFAAMSLLLAACSDPVDPLQPEQEPLIAPATVVVSVDTVRAVLDRSGNPTYLQLKFPVAISNTSVDTIRVTHCSTTLQNERHGRWLYAGGGGCFLSIPDKAPIPPGETVQFSATVNVAYSGPYAEFTGALPGRYRYDIGFLRYAAAGSDFVTLGNKPSNPFVVVLDD